MAEPNPSDAPANKALFVLDLSACADMDDFYTVAAAQLCPKFAGFGRNLSAFTDVLRGGFGSFDSDEDIIVEVRGCGHARRHLREFEDILEILRESDAEVVLKE